MKSHLLRCLASAALLHFPYVATAAEPALQRGAEVNFPALTSAEWLQGEAPKAFEPGKLYLFECWATWCCGCVANIPHLNELHRKFHDKGLLVYGMDVWEDDKERVVKFVRMKGEKMSYPVAFTGRNSPFDQKWLQAIGQKSIPYVFLVKDGKLVLSCQPSYLTEETVQALLDPARFEATAEKIAQVATPQEIMDKARFKFDRAKERKDFAGMDEAIAACERVNPEDWMTFNLKLERNLLKQDWSGSLQVIESMPTGTGRDRVLRKMAERLACWPAESFARDFREPFVPIYRESLKAPALKAEAENYLFLAVLQWSAGDRDAACASAAQAITTAKNDHGTKRSSTAFEKFAAALKAGTLPTMGEYRTWERESR